MKYATLAIIEKDGQVLLGYKKKGVEEISDILNGPGGKVETGETPEQCVVRETEDELGILLDIYSLEKVALITFLAGGIADFIVHVYRTSVFMGEPQETRVMVPHWFPIIAIPYERMLEGDREWFPNVLAG
ncbi:MAG TPA: NUDIX domain-containing protein, partial [Candidatus Paceibacterota bacterium]